MKINKITAEEARELVSHSDSVLQCIYDEIRKNAVNGRSRLIQYGLSELHIEDLIQNGFTVEYAPGNTTAHVIKWGNAEV